MSSTSSPKKGPLNYYIAKPTQGSAALVWKNHFIACVGEFVGTFLFLFFAYMTATVANQGAASVTGSTKAGADGKQYGTLNTSSLLMISFGFGFSLAATVWIFFRVSGGLFNPAVSFGMALVGAISPIRAALLFIVQILGGICAAAVTDALTPGTLPVRCTLGTDVSVARGLFIEMFTTAFLMISIFMLAGEQHKATHMAPLGIGLALFMGHTASIYWTGAGINPARAFGPDVVTRTFNGYHWIYWVGPLLGAAVSAGFYKFLKVLEYETVLGPEDPVSKTVLDEEKAGGHEVEVPGIGGRLAGPDASEERLARIETLLTQLSANGATSQHVAVPAAGIPAAVINRA